MDEPQVEFDARKMEGASFAGVATLLHPVVMCDGAAYSHIFAPRWLLIKQHDGTWCHVACDADGRWGAFVPERQVCGFSLCDSNPSYAGGPQVYSVGGTAAPKTTPAGEEGVEVAP